MNRAKEKELFQRLEKLSGQERLELRNQITMNNFGLVVKEAMAHRDRGVDLDDLCQAGSIGLLKAIDKFEWRRGWKFSTYATYWILQAIKREIQNMADTVSVTPHVYHLLKTIRDAKLRLMLDGNENPTAEELSEETNPGLSLHVVEKMLPMLNYGLTQSMDYPVSEDGATLHDFFGSKDSPFENVQALDMRERVRLILDRLELQEQKIVRMRFRILE